MNQDEKPIAGGARQTLRLTATDPAGLDVAIETAARILAGGGLVAFPTETVYGLGADALNDKAVRSIFEAKGRPADNPLIVHVGRFEDVAPLVRSLPDKARELARLFWPGPLTMVLPASPALPRVVTAGLDTVGVRLPAHEVARRLILKSGVPVAAPSANVSGSPSPTRAEHVWHDLNGRIDAVLDGGPCEVGIESTVLDLSGEVPVILRPGGVAPDDLQRVLPDLVVPPFEGVESDDVPRAPGMKYRHYAPKARMLLVEGQEGPVVAEMHRQIDSWRARGHCVGVLASDEHAPHYDANVVRVLAPRNEPAEAARNLFALLREMDERGADVILVEAVDREGIGFAVMNRLWKAASGGIIHAH